MFSAPLIQGQMDRADIIPITVTSIPDSGITLTSPDDAKFDPGIRSVLGDLSDAALTLRPYTVLVSNATKHVVVAYVVAWNVTRANGADGITYLELKYPDAVAGEPGANPLPRGGEIRPGETTVASTYCTLTASNTRGWILRMADVLKERLGGVKRLEVSLDAAIFDDGIRLGPDASGMAADFVHYVEAKQAVYASVLGKLDNGAPEDAVFNEVRTSMLGITPQSIASALDANPFLLYQRLAREEMLTWRQHFGDAQIRSVLKRALRLRPFTVQETVASASNNKPPISINE